MNLLRTFNATLARRPLITQIVVSGAVSGAGDAFTQYLTGQKHWDYMRTARFSCLAAVFIAPPLNVWFRVLERVRFTNKHAQVFARMSIDQFMFSPIFNAIILVNLRLLEGISFDGSVARMKKDWYDVYTSSLRLWPAVQLVNFYFVPLNYRVILIQVVAFFWNSWLSFKTQAPALDEPTVEPPAQYNTDEEK
ncbi:hypothetical protein CAEBREN_01060 [Caenorhabditis brenneri]|uniref:Mitochondrial inner membrane protein Mpv17 n=1 Tax=Caenorhabditis brenneri TaxID=135651 RepID=G0MQC5_CAEBE|nr:hypothetical protein CAEBREN_02918 [Caenorhabditis brenneri]EGT53340.1 hypothetical protein CAEBREN_01060 [Caenorhabditis brenneri]